MYGCDSFSKKILNKVHRKLCRLITSRYSAKDREIKYWQKAGIRKGNDFYKKYLIKFPIESSSLHGKVIADFGAGPFGGILSVLDDVEKRYPIDILANEYNLWGFSKFKIYGFNGKRTNLPPGIADVIFCCNTIDHTRYPNYIVKEIARLLKKNGVLFLHVHLRRDEELNEAHPLSWDERLFRNIFEKEFIVERCRIESSDEVNDSEYKTLYSKLIKI